MKNIATIILAAGRGTRMKSEKAKVLHTLNGKSLLTYPLQLSASTKSTVVVVGHQKKEVEQAVLSSGKKNILFAHQKEQLGTGHAVLTGLSKLKKHDGPVLILSGDVPLLSKSTIRHLKKAYDKTDSPVAFLTFNSDNPKGYGRIIKNGNAVVAIREEKDCSSQEKKIQTVNAGIYLIDAKFLKKAAKSLKNENAQGEFYLTDIIAIAAENYQVAALSAPMHEVTGINTRVDLANLEKIIREKTAKKYMLAGVSIAFPETVYIEQECKIGKDTVIGQGVHLLGKTKIGKNVIIEPGVIISYSIIGDNALIKAYSVIEQADVGIKTEVGPMARLRPGSILKTGSKVGNWVELKKTVLGEGSKANHLAYLGDGIIGKNVNIGAGCIFCNYDGFLKHQTIVEDDVFIGSDSQVVAPALIEKGAYVASGTTVVKTVPAGDLAISRVKQINRKGLATMLKKRLKARKQQLSNQSRK